MIFEEKMRYDYALNSKSLVLDIGAYEGHFAALIHNKYACDVSMFEPLTENYHKCMRVLSVMPVFRVYKKGVGGSNKKELIHIENDRSGKFSKGETEEVEILDIKDVVGNKKIDLIKINIEGMEYELLERVIECDLQTQLINIQVQFHDYAPNFKERYEKIREKLLETHELTFDFPFLWQNFRLKDKNNV